MLAGRRPRIFAAPAEQPDSGAMTIHPADGSTPLTARQRLARWNLELERGRPPIRYGFSVVCVAVALAAALAWRRYGFGDAALPLFELAIVVTTWFAGVGPSALAVALSIASFDYFFVEPLYSFEVSRAQLPYLFVFIAFAAITAWFVVALQGAMSDFSLRARPHSNLIEQGPADRSNWLRFLP